MNDVEISVYPAALQNVPDIYEIYSFHVINGLASWELTPPSFEEFEDRFKAIVQKGFPYFVAQIEQVTVGFIYASSYRPRLGYLYTVENSVYVHPEYRRRNVGYLLLQHLITACEDLGYRQMVAVIGDSGNMSSIRLHEKSGFHHVGILSKIGFKHGQWLDCVLMQRELGLGGQDLPPKEPLFAVHGQ